MKDQWVKAGMVSSLGIEMTLAVGLFTWAGSEADSRFETDPVFALVGFVLGLITAVFSMMRTLRRIEKMTPKVKFERKNLASVDPLDTRAFHLPETRWGDDAAPDSGANGKPGGGDSADKDPKP